MKQCGRPAGRAGFVLVGGSSARMGRDKALLPYGGATLAEHVAARVQAAAGSVALVGHPERYRGLRYPVVPDLHPGWGPLAGIQAALHASDARWNLVAACDMPALTAEFLISLLDRAETCHGLCLAPLSPAGRPEPLCAVWDRDCRQTIDAALLRNIRKMNGILQAIGAVYWPVAEAAWFENLNTPRDWAGHGEASPAARKTP